MFRDEVAAETVYPETSGVAFAYSETTAVATETSGVVFPATETSGVVFPKAPAIAVKPAAVEIKNAAVPAAAILR